MKRIMILGVAVVVLLVAGCGSDDDDSASGEFNDADVEFAQGMIPHHEQAIEMTRLAETRAQSPEVKDLAMRIEDAQGPEIEQMRGWLEEWDEPVGGGESHGGGHEGEMGGMGMEGMMSDGEMSRLESASGAAFDRMFLEMMTEHHEGAVTMAQTELEEGEFAEAQDLAQAIIDAQEAEIDEMRGLLGQV